MSASGSDARILYVSDSDPACGGQSPCFSTIQAAVDAANEEDEVRVAAGTYRGSTTSMVGDNSYVQVVLITKSLTLQGGYATSDWTTPDPARNPTIIDAQDRGRCVTIVGDGTQVVSVGGFRITRGDYSELGNPPGVSNQVCARTGSDCGGGLFAYGVTLYLRDAVITDNIASRTRGSSDGGGAYLWQLNAGSLIENTTFRRNLVQVSDGAGGGACVDSGQSITFRNARFEENQSNGDGGGLFVFQPNGEVLIEDTTFDRNISNQDGGALEARLVAPDVALRLNRVSMLNNQARAEAPALSLWKQGSEESTVELTNVLMAANTLTGPGDYSAVINCRGSSVGMNIRMAHVTWAAHGSLSALRLASSGGSLRATIVNALIDTALYAFVGRQVGGDIVIRHNRTLTNRVLMLHGVEEGIPVFEAMDPLTGNPRLNAMYRLRTGSAAIDAGVISGIPDDIERDPRPFGAGYDIGADEFVAPGKR